MRLFRRRGGTNGIVAAAALVAAACARGESTSIDDLESDAGTLDAGSSRRDGSVTLPPGTPPPPPGDAGDDTGTGTLTGSVVINEVKTAGASASDEFIELMNTGTSTVSLSGWKLLYRSASNGASATPLYTFAAADSIPGGSRVFVASTNITGRLGMLNAGMAASDGQVGLVDGNGKTVDGVAYGSVSSGTYLEGSSAPSPPTSGSIARTPDGTDTNDNSKDFKATTSPTPGAPN